MSESGPTEPEPILLQEVPQGSRFRRAHWLPRDAALGVAIAPIAAGFVYCGTLGMFKAVPSTAVSIFDAIEKFGVLLALPLWLLRKRREQPYAHRLPSRRIVREFLIAIPVTIGVLICVGIVGYSAMFVLKACGHPPESARDFWGQMPERGMIQLLLKAVIIAPVIEEVFFRGFLYNALRTVAPESIAIVCAGSTIWPRARV